MAERECLETCVAFSGAVEFPSINPLYHPLGFDLLYAFVPVRFTTTILSSDSSQSPIRVGSCDVAISHPHRHPKEKAA